MSNRRARCISVVTPSLNQGEFIGETIESVLGQEGDFYLDYIIMDGGSTDGSVETIKKYESLLAAGEWPTRCRGIRYRWMSARDEGQADAVNRGFLMAEGEIAAWLNADDAYLPGAVKRVLDIFRTEPRPDVVYGKAHFTDEKGVVIGKYPTGPFDYAALATFNYVCQPATFFRKEAWEKAGGLDASLHYVMDYDLWIRMAVDYRFVYLPEFVATYRLHERSKTIAAADAVANHEECLRQVLKHYRRAPLNRVYGYCYHLLKERLPRPLSRLRPLLITLSVLFSAAKYLRLNRTIRADDLKMINSRNLAKTAGEWMDIYKKY